MNLAREWTAFAGALFALIAGVLVSGARRSAQDVLSWQRQWRDAVGAPQPPVADEEPLRRRIVLAYRLGGAAFAAAGAVLLAFAATSRVPFRAREGSRETLAGGAILTACGLILAFSAWVRARRTAPRFAGDELLGPEAPPPFAERAAAACTRGIVVLLLAFGFRLLREGLR